MRARWQKTCTLSQPIEWRQLAQLRAASLSPKG